MWNLRCTLVTAAFWTCTSCSSAEQVDTALDSHSVCAPTSELEAQASPLACAQLSVAETCGDGEVQSGELCWQAGELEAPELPDFEVGETTGFSAAAGDIDGDGFIDIAAVFEGGGTRYALVAYFGNGDGSFAEPRQASFWKEPSGRPKLSDLDGDGLMDVVVAGVPLGMDETHVLVFHADVDRTFDATSLRIGTGGPRENFVIGDFDANGHEDILAEGGEVLYGSGERAFDDYTTVAVGGMVITNIQGVTDLDGDGARDLIARLMPPSSSRASQYVLPGFADGMAGERQQLPDGEWQTAIDIDSDEQQELIALGFERDIETGDVVERLDFANADQSGTYVAETGPNLTLLREKEAFWTQGLQKAQVNGDEYPDIVFVPMNELIDAGCDVPHEWHTVRVLLGHGDGGFEEAACHPALSMPARDLAVADLNQDGVSDFVAPTPAGIELLLSNP